MSRPDDLLAAALRESEVPLETGFSSRVHAIARAELAPDETAVAPLAQLRMAMAGAVVPALLVSAAVTRVAQTVSVAETVFASEGSDTRN
jgi:hypothetical protein